MTFKTNGDLHWALVANSLYGLLGSKIAKEYTIAASSNLFCEYFFEVQVLTTFINNTVEDAFGKPVHTPTVACRELAEY